MVSKNLVKTVAPSLFTSEMKTAPSVGRDTFLPSESNARSYDWDQVATVETEILPGSRGRVRFQASWWRATCPYPIHIPVGTRVQVVGREGLTLQVAPLYVELPEPA